MNEDRENLFDNRIAARKMAAGKITAKELEEYLEKLEDCEELAEECESRFVHTARLDPQIRDDE